MFNALKPTWLGPLPSDFKRLVLWIGKGTNNPSGIGHELWEGGYSRCFPSGMRYYRYRDHQRSKFSFRFSPSLCQPYMVFSITHWIPSSRWLISIAKKMTRQKRKKKKKKRKKRKKRERERRRRRGGVTALPCFTTHLRPRCQPPPPSTHLPCLALALALARKRPVWRGRVGKEEDEEDEEETELPPPKKKWKWKWKWKWLVCSS